MKLRHLLLFLIICFVLIASDFTGGSLLALFAWLQINLLLSQKTLSKKSQIWAFYLFLFSIPLVLMWGSCLSFLFIYFHEKVLPFFIMSAVINMGLSLIAVVLFIFSYFVAEESEFKIALTLSLAFNLLKTKKKLFLFSGGLIFVCSLAPIINPDWKIVFAIMATHLILNRNRLKLVF